MEMVKESEVKRPVILITNDNKKDWWLKIGDKIVGPRPELIKEILQHNVKFHMYTMEKFLEIAKPIYKVNLTTIKEIGEVNKKNIEGFLGKQNENLAETTSIPGVEFNNQTILEEAGEQTL